MIFELQRKLAFKGLSGWHDSPIGPFFQHTSIPVIGPHHAKQNAILKNGAGYEWCAETKLNELLEE